LWKGCDGRTPWDLNDPNGVYLSGTAGSGSSGQTLVVTGANFTTNQWQGYVVINLDQPYNDGRYSYPDTMAAINSNDATNIVVSQAPHAARSQVWNEGNRFEIRKVLTPMDNVGNGPGDYLGGGFNPAPRSLNQTSEPYYLWSNTNNGILQGGYSSTWDVVAGVNFINNGTTAKSGYKPYTYPHPLTRSLPPSATVVRDLSRKHWGAKQKKPKEVKKNPEKKTEEKTDT
jgi:hypothetical protein